MQVSLLRTKHNIVHVKLYIPIFYVPAITLILYILCSLQRKKQVEHQLVNNY